MQVPSARLGATLLALVLVHASADNGTPVQKVVEMMEEMAAKAKKEKNDEVVAFAKIRAVLRAHHWC